MKQYILNKSYPQAREAYRCDGCYEGIHKHEVYQSVIIVDNIYKTITNYKFCSMCGVVIGMHQKLTGGSTIDWAVQGGVFGYLISKGLNYRQINEFRQISASEYLGELSGVQEYQLGFD